MRLRCRHCDRNLEQHKTLAAARCLNPHCREFDRWLQIRPRAVRKPRERRPLPQGETA